MTIVIGILCKDGLVMASDSQAMSQRGVDVKRMDYSKIHSLGDDTGMNVFVSGAGAVPFISKFIEKLRDACDTRRVKNVKEFVEVAEDVMDELTKRYVVKKVRDLGISRSKKMLGHFRNQEGMELPHLPVVVMAGLFDERPYLFIISPEGVAEKEENFASIGSGSAYSEYVLSRLYYPELTVNEAIELAVYVIEEVKKIDPNVGGDVQVKILDKDGQRELTSKEILEVSQRITERDELLSRLWRMTLSGKKKDSDLAKFVCQESNSD